MQNDYRGLLDEKERTYFSQYATLSSQCLGRKRFLVPDSHRSEFERDCHRILHSLPFRRLKHKTQVFVAPKNDHICTRMEHALHVASICSTICIHLGLNVTLAEAISLAHDLGHPPFGHAGEEALSKIHEDYSLSAFAHEAQSLRVIDNFKDRAHNYTLNLTYEVRDGVVCHWGEPNEQSLRPDREKDIKAVDTTAARHEYPGTLESCVVRVADQIAYLGRDFEDAVEAGIIERDCLPSEIKCCLGESNSEIIGTLVHDTIQESKEVDRIQFSDNVFTGFTQLKDFNYEKIYKSKEIDGQSGRIENILRDLFDAFFEAITEARRGQENRRCYEGYYYRVFFEFLDDMEYPENGVDAQIVSDFVAGMTDNFAIGAFQDLFLISPPV